MTKEEWIKIIIPIKCKLENELGHNFGEFSIFDIYYYTVQSNLICLKCNQRFLFDFVIDSKNEITKNCNLGWVHAEDNIFYSLITESGYNNLTCKEFIIKNIIE